MDGQLHQKERQFLQLMAKNIGVNAETETAAELILAQSDEHLGLEDVILGIAFDQRRRALALAALASLYVGVLDKTEEQLLGRLKVKWEISEEWFRSSGALMAVYASLVRLGICIANQVWGRHSTLLPNLEGS